MLNAMDLNAMNLMSNDMSLNIDSSISNLFNDSWSLLSRPHSLYLSNSPSGSGGITS